MIKVDFSSRNFHRSTFGFSNFNLEVKRVKRLVLRPLSTNTDRWTNRSRTSSNDHLVYHFKRLSLKQKNSSENLYSYNLFNIQINPKIQCRIVRYSDDKFYIPCHELADLLQIREEELDRETVRSNLSIRFDCFE